MKKIDPYTREEFFTSKRNQKFACRENQIAYNNELKAREREALSFITKKLYSNRDILKNLLGSSDEEIIDIEIMKNLGYDFYVLTHYKVINKKQTYCVFEYSFTINKNQVKINKDGRAYTN